MKLKCSMCKRINHHARKTDKGTPCFWATSCWGKMIPMNGEPPEPKPGEVFDLALQSHRQGCEHIFDKVGYLTSAIDRHLTSKALNALWCIENSARARHDQRPRLWRPSRDLLLSCKYEQLVRIPSVGPRTAELIMKWKRKFTKGSETDGTENAHQGLPSTGTD